MDLCECRGYSVLISSWTRVWECCVCVGGRAKTKRTQAQFVYIYTPVQRAEISLWILTSALRRNLLALSKQMQSMKSGTFTLAVGSI